MKYMKCKHYKGDGYTYELNDKESINLCAQCEMNLYSEMVKQAAIETKAQPIVNEMHQRQMDKQGVLIQDIDKFLAEKLLKQR